MADGIDSGLSRKALMVIIFSTRRGDHPRWESGQVIGRTVQLNKLLSTKMRDRALVKNSSQVESIYGYWPSFHDAEILNIRFARGLSANEKVASVIVDLNYWETKAINEGTSTLDYVLDKNNIIAIEFSGLVTSLVSGFSFQNVIDELLLTEIEEGIKAEFVSIHGAEVMFVCKAVAVLGVWENA